MSVKKTTTTKQIEKNICYLKKVHSSPLNKKIFVVQTMILQAKLLSQCFLNSFSMVMNISKMFSQHYKIISLKKVNLELNLSLISNKAPDLSSVISFEMNTKNEYEFMGA